MTQRIVLLGMMLVVGIILYFVYTNMNQIFHSIPILELPIRDARAGRFRLVIDVRTPKEREDLGSYPNSIPISIDDLKKEVPFLIGSGPASKQAHMLVYSNGDRRSQLAAETLYDMGYIHTRYISKSYLHLLPGSQPSH
jgi:rhodanese-related sulfurtransferase